MGSEMCIRDRNRVPETFEGIVCVVDGHDGNVGEIQDRATGTHVHDVHATHIIAGFRRAHLEGKPRLFLNDKLVTVQGTIDVDAGRTGHICTGQTDAHAEAIEDNTEEFRVSHTTIGLQVFADTDRLRLNTIADRQ